MVTAFFIDYACRVGYACRVLLRPWISNQHPAVVAAIPGHVGPLYYLLVLVVLGSTYLKGVGMEILRTQTRARASLGVGLLTSSVLRFHKALD